MSTSCKSVVSVCEALKCNCGGLRHCSPSVETCSGFNNVCASVIIYAGSTPRYFQGCMKSPDCRIMNQPGVSSATCCTTDLCNRYMLINMYSFSLNEKFPS
uniref:UPAR/Ly6 domain-containing protein n=1 Tax=Amphilophus citrinellus TaxID=61819 RepID=A0A3Q0RTJ4_AMPCI